MKSLLFILFFFFVALSAGQTLKSKVTKATVFKDRAMVTRSAETDLPAGISSVVFSKLTPELRDASVTVAVTNAAVKILDVKVERKFTREIRRNEVRKIQEKLYILNQKQRIITDKIAIYHSKKDFVESLKAESVKYVNMKILLNTSSAKKWKELLNFIDTNLNEIYSGIRSQVILNDKLDKEIHVQKKLLEQYKGVKSRDYKQIIITLESEHAAHVNIQPSYLVKNAGWYPMYDARVYANPKKMELSYYGMVQQGTGEDWNDIKLTLSTVDPVSVKKLPELTPWFIDVNPLPRHPGIRPQSRNRSGLQIDYEQVMGMPGGKGAISGYILDKDSGEALPGVNVSLKGTGYGSVSDSDGKFYISNVPAKNYTLTTNYIGYQKVNVRLDVLQKQIARLNLHLAESNLEMNEAVVITAQRPLVSQNIMHLSSTVQGIQKSKKSKYTNINAQDISTTFELKTKNNIPSDNGAHKVTIDVVQLPIQFEYTATPKLLEKVYLKGKTLNTNDYPLLEGDINIFVENNFVNKTFIKTIVPTDTLKLALGYDENIKIEKTLKNKFLESKGFLSGAKRVTYTFEIKVTNNRSTVSSLTIYDQSPQSMNEKLKVNLIRPGKDEKVRQKSGNLIWHIKLNPGETRILPLKFSVEFPSNVDVYGLE